VLGAALREALTGDHPLAFVARVTAAVAARQWTSWEVLASWARPGIAAAVAALLAGFLVGGVSRASTAVDLLASTVGPSAREVVTALRPPDPGALLVSFEEE
jgi:hypothetical protein